MVSSSFSFVCSSFSYFCSSTESSPLQKNGEESVHHWDADMGRTDLLCWSRALSKWKKQLALDVNSNTYPNPLQDNPAYSVVKQYFVHVDDTVPQKVVVHKDSPRGVHFRRAGPVRRYVSMLSGFIRTIINICGNWYLIFVYGFLKLDIQVYFESDEVQTAIVTCGGLCPGLNTVIRELVCGLHHMYGVKRVLAIEGRKLSNASSFLQMKNCRVNSSREPAHDVLFRMQCTCFC